MSTISCPEFKLSVTLMLVIVVVMISGCQKPVETPAKTIVGSYTSSDHAPVYFADQSDSCTQGYNIYDSTGVIINWQITYLEENLVTIIASAIGMDSTVLLKLDKLGTVCQLGKQFSFPDTLRGIVGGKGPSTLVVERRYVFYDTLKPPHPHNAYVQLGSFALTAGTISGTLSDIVCDTLPAHCYGYRTREFTLYKD